VAKFTSNSHPCGCTCCNRDNQENGFKSTSLINKALFLYCAWVGNSLRWKGQRLGIEKCISGASGTRSRTSTNGDWTADWAVGQRGVASAGAALLGSLVAPDPPDHPHGSGWHVAHSCGTVPWPESSCRTAGGAPVGSSGDGRPRRRRVPAPPSGNPPPAAPAARTPRRWPPLAWKHTKGGR